ncbi:MAG: hypothetical protein U5K76_10720 [Woeseiaceae bacterium]|nr:hypothetical protein [Woeseiaceae bacterium]
MTRNTVEELVRQWGLERPGMDVSALGVVVRLQLLSKLLARRANRALKTRLDDAEAALAGLTPRERQRLGRQLADLLNDVEGTPVAQRRR